MAAIRTLKAGKVPGPDNLLPQLFLYLDKKCFEWLQTHFFNFLSTKKLPKEWNMAKVIAALKTSEPADILCSYKSISLPCIPYKLCEGLINNRIKPIIESVLPKEEAGFQTDHWTLDQIVLFIDDFETFDKKLEPGIVFVNLSAAYDTVWHRSLTKIVKKIPSKEIVNAIIGMISQCRLQVHNGK